MQSGILQEGLPAQWQSNTAVSVFLNYMHVNYSYLQALWWSSILCWPHQRHLLVSCGGTVISILHMTRVMFSKCLHMHSYSVRTRNNEGHMHNAMQKTIPLLGSLHAEIQWYIHPLIQVYTYAMYCWGPPFAVKQAINGHSTKVQSRQNLGPGGTLCTFAWCANFCLHCIEHMLNRVRRV